MRLLSLVLLWLLSLALPAHGAEPVEIEHIVAVVNDDIILASELDSWMHRVKQQLRERNTRLPSEAVLRKQVLERLIMTNLQLQFAKRAGIRVDDATLNRTMRKIASENGLTLGQFHDILQRDGVDFAEFREDIRDEITISRLRQQQVGNKIVVSEREIDNFLAKQPLDTGIRYHLAHILIALPEAASPEQIQAAKQKAEKIVATLSAGADFKETAVAESDAPDALEGGDLGWRQANELPTLIGPLVPKMEVGEIMPPLRSPSGFHIIKLLDAEGRGPQHIVTQTSVRHILIRVNEVISDVDAQTRLSQIRERVEGGGDFAELARAHSDDTASAVKGGYLGWVRAGELEPRFEQAIAQLSPGELSEPFKTRAGWHLAQVLDRRQQDDTQEFQRTKVRAQLHERKYAEELSAWLRRLRAEAYVEYRLDEDI
jgi:peptidyl-prolyl cis-trans isomerase SurA